MSVAKFGSFLTIEEFDEFKIDHKLVSLILTETYNEYSLKDSIEKIGKDICCCVAIQLAIVGYGNKNYGSVKFNGVVVDIADFCKKNHVKSDLNINAKLKPEDVTPRRLIRFFRYSIKDYISQNKECQSYLFKKYCLDKNDDTRSFVYPGFEHIAEPSVDLNKVKKLIETYGYLDYKLNTHIKERIVRVLIARGFNKEIFNENKYDDLK